MTLASIHKAGSWPAFQRVNVEETSIQQFRIAIQDAGLHPPEVIEADGTLHRFASNGKRGDDAG